MQQTNTGKKHDNNLTFVRLTAAILVFAGHMSLIVGRTPPVLEVISNHLHMRIHEMGVCLLFLVGGYLITKSWLSDPNPFRYGVRRFMRLWPPFAVVVLIMTFVTGPLLSSFGPAGYFKLETSLGFNWLTYLQNLRFYIIFAQPGVFDRLPLPNVTNGSLWTMPVEAVMYILTPLLLLLVSLGRRKKNSFIPMLVITAAACIADVVLRTFYWELHVNFYGTDWIYAFHLSVFYFVGMLFTYEEIQRRLNLLFSAAALCLMLVIQFFYAPAVYLVLYVGFPTFLFSFALKAKPIRVKFLNGLDISYGIFLYGFFFQQLAVWLQQMAGIRAAWLPTFFMSLVPTIGAALLSMHFVEQPCLGLGRSVVNWHRAGGMEKAWQGALAYMKKAAGAVRKAAVPLKRVALHQPGVVAEKRIQWIDVAKCVGMYLIYLGHFGPSSGKSYPFLFVFHVPLFFFLSGCTEALNRETSLIRNLKKKTVRILFPYYGFCILSLLLFAVLNRPGPDVMKQYILAGLCGSVRNQFINQTLWFLTCLFVVGVLFSFLRKLKFSFLILLASLAVFFVAQQLIPFNLVSEPQWFYNVDSALYYQIFYCFGYLLFGPLHRLLESRAPAARIFVAASAVAAFIYCAYLYMGENLLRSFYFIPVMGSFYEALATCIPIWLVIVLSRLLDRVRLLQKVGRNSIYLCGSEYLVKSVFWVVMMKAAGIDVFALDNPVVVHLYALALLIVVNYTFVPVEKKLFGWCLPPVTGSAREKEQSKE